MSINVEQLKKYIISPVLKEYNRYTESAVNLLLGTCAQESLMGTYIRQFPKGPACGIYQMEPTTHDDIWHNYISFKPFLKEKIKGEFGLFDEMSSMNLIGNLWYATLMCRLHYSRISERLPEADDITGLAVYWKQYYNTKAGKGTIEEFIENYKRFVLN